MVRYMVECVTLLTVSVFALDCSWCEVETGGEGTSGMITLPWWDGVVKICGGDWWIRCKVAVFKHGGGKEFR